MMDERRKDYIDIVGMLKDGVENSTNIRSMKKTLDKHGKDIGEIKDVQIAIASDVKGLNVSFDEFLKYFKDYKIRNEETEKKINGADDRLKSLEFKLKLVLAGILAFFSGLGTILLLFGKKIAAALAILLP